MPTSVPTRTISKLFTHRHLRQQTVITMAAPDYDAIIIGADLLAYISMYLYDFLCVIVIEQFFAFSLQTHHLLYT
jgi:hypothetical protein